MFSCELKCAVSDCSLGFYCLCKQLVWYVYQEMTKLVYGTESSFNAGLAAIQALNPQFYDNVVRNWLPVKELFAGFERCELFHLDSHTNNKLER